MADELVAVADIVGLVVFGVGEDHEDAIGGEVMKFTPKPGANKQSLGGGRDQDALLPVPIKQADPQGPGYAHAKLPEFFVRMEAAADTRLSAVDPVDSADREWQRPAEFGDGKPASTVSVLRKVDEPDEA